MPVQYIEDRRKALNKLDKDRLIDDTINGELNRFVSSYADYDEDETGSTPRFDKRVPYIGWYWRSVDFTNNRIYIGHCGEFVGFMENNKWGYPERMLDDNEAEKVVALVCEAYELSREGGLLSDIQKNTKSKLEEIWPLMQTFEVESEGWWVHSVIAPRVAFASTKDEAESIMGHMQDAAPGVRYWITET